MRRRNFLKLTILSGMAMGFTNVIDSRKTHVLTLSFDDGFKKSFYKLRRSTNSSD